MEWGQEIFVRWEASAVESKIRVCERGGRLAGVLSGSKREEKGKVSALDKSIGSSSVVTRKAE